MLETAQKGAVRLTAPNVRHGADGLWVVVCPPRVVIDAIVWHPGWWFPGAWDGWQVLEVCVHVVSQRWVLAVLHVLGKLVVGVQVYVSVAQAIPMRFLFDEMQDDVFGEAPQGCPEV